jgi:hypothetical protein
MKHCIITSLAALLCAAAPTLVAQNAAAPDAATLAKYDKNHNGKLDPDEIAAMPADERELIQLSPFEVRTDKDVGYQAVDGGMGGRVDLPFKDVASGMSSITKEFMEDWALTDMRDSFRYSMNVDAAGNSGQNQNGTPFGDFQFNFRGVGDAGNYPTRNTFLNYSVQDFFNVERADMSMGPNSTFFGDGQIGGLATSVTKLARLSRDAYNGVARWDSFGGWRFTADANKVVAKNFAVRTNLLYQKNALTAISQWRDGARSAEKAFDAAMTYKITPTTEFAVDVEFDNKRYTNMPTTYGDQIGYFAPGYLFDRTIPNLPASQGLAGITQVTGNAENRNYIPSTGAFINTGGGTANVANTRTYRSTGPGIAIQPNGRSDLPGIVTTASLPGGKEFNFGPNDTWSRFKEQTYTFNLDHRFSDLVSARLQFYDYNNDRNQLSGTVGGNGIQYDINKYLPDGTPNPKAGKLYAEMTPGKSYQENYVYEWRGLVSYRTPLPFWNARGQFSGVVGTRSERFEARGLSPARTDNPASQIWTNAENTLRYRYYVEDGLKYGGAGTLPAPRPGFTYNWIQTGFASVEHKDIYYVQAIGALQLWQDRVSLTGGVRNDDLNDDQYGNIGGFNDAHGLQSYGGFVPGTGTRPGAHNLTKAGALTGNAGIVAWIDPGQHIGGFYSFNSNFAPPTSGAAKIIGFNPDGTINGAAFGATRGKGSEFGLRFNFLGGRVSGEARYYKNDQVDQISNPPTGNFRSLWGSSGPTYANDANFTQMDWRDVAALQSSGYEFKTTANLGGLRLQANYALPRTKSVDVRPVTKAYFDAFQAKWASWAANLQNDKGEALTTAEGQNIATQILNIQNNIAGSAPGTVNNATVKWSGSLAATYQFSQETLMRGFSVGYGINGRGRRKTSSMPASILFGLTAPGARAATPAENEAAAFAYLYQPSYYLQDANVAYRTRFGKYRVRFQLNVNNITNKADLLFNSYTTYRVLGQNTNPLLGMFPSGFNYLEPRKFILTTTVDF